MTYWPIKVLFLLVSMLADYVLAAQLSTDSSGLWQIFAVLILGPIFFALKYGFIKCVFWVLFLKNNALNELLLTFERQSWPYPDMNYRNGMDYLEDIMIDEDISPELRVTAARMYGHLENQFQSVRILDATLENKVLTQAVQVYRISKTQL